MFSQWCEGCVLGQPMAKMGTFLGNPFENNNPFGATVAFPETSGLILGENTLQQENDFKIEKM